MELPHAITSSRIAWDLPAAYHRALRPFGGPAAEHFHGIRRHRPALHRQHLRRKKYQGHRQQQEQNNCREQNLQGDTENFTRG